ncbi:MAG: Ku protein [Solirubrobacterales bacterium]
MWKGSIGFGLVNVPVELVTASRDLDYHFRELHEKDGAPVKHRRFSSKTGKEVPWDEVGKGIEVDGKMVVLTEKELEGVQPDKNQTIEIESFADLGEIDPIYYDHPYFLVPGNKSAGTLRAYNLLVEAMKKSNRVALGRFVMRTKEYLAAVRERDGVLALSTMRYPDEVRSVDLLPEWDAETESSAIDDAVSVIDERTVDWDPEKYEDAYRMRLKKVIDSKLKGETVKAPEAQSDEDLKPAPDLMAALRKTLDERRDNRKRSAGRAKPSGSAKGDLSQLSRDELYAKAQERKVPGRSAMSKKDLIKALDQG